MMSPDPDDTLPRHGWQQHGLCAGMDVDRFFPTSTGDVDHLDLIDMCVGCPVRADCLTYAVDNSIWYGIWGGTTPNDRKQLRRRQQRRKART